MSLSKVSHPLKIQLRFAGFGVLLLWLRLSEAAPAEYLEAAGCTPCHQTIAASYAGTSMGNSFRSVPRETTPRASAAGSGFPGFDGSRYDHQPSREHFAAFRRDGIYYVRRDQTGPGGTPVNLVEEPVDYVIGSGNHAFSYLRRKLDNTLVEFPVSWYSEDGGHWGMSPAYDRPDHPGFSRTISYRCMFCHNAYPIMAAGADAWDGGTRYPQQLPEGIDCQRCHGPGSEHVNAARRGDALNRIRTAIVNPARLSPQRQLEVCMQCHLETTSMQLPGAMMRSGRSVFSWRPGEPLGDYQLYFDHATQTGHDDKFELVSTAYRLRQSACFRASPDRITCTACHDPHRASTREESIAATARTCRSCHGSLLAKHPAGQDCGSCHMPRRKAEDAVHITIADHRIQLPRVLTPPAREVHDGNTLPYAGVVVLYYPEKTDAMSLAMAQVKQLANVPAGLIGLESLLAERRLAPGEVWFDMAEALFGTAQVRKSIRFYEEALKREPANWRYVYGLGMSWRAAGEPGTAATVLERAVTLAPFEAGPLHELAFAEAARNRASRAVSLFRKALSLDPESAPALNNLGNTLAAMGDARGAEAALREAVRLQPEPGALHVNLGNVLAENGKPAAAAFEFEEAIRIGPSTESAQSAWFVKLAATGSMEAARESYERSLRIQMHGAHNNLGNVLLMLGNAEGSIREFRAAVSADPSSAASLMNLGLTLAAHGDAVEARTRLREALRIDPESGIQLRKATQSKDAKVRAIATEVLRKVP